MSSSSLVHGSKLRGPSLKALEWLNCVSLIITHSITKATEGLLETNLIIVNRDQVTRTTPELAPHSPNFHTSPTYERLLKISPTHKIATTLLLSIIVDIAKACNKIWHDGLLSKMMRLGFSDQLIKIIHSYLNSREFRVKVENSLSTPHPILSGVPQGSLLEPKLFNLYINDIPKAAEVHLAMYVDDTAIFTQNIYNCNIIERLQNYVIRLLTWLITTGK
ncbi:probable RNA-directed DNA polymerase from transposon BS [Trichonephila clavipes]|nr:probable RNA-directed DNA polymerase from transposon BS [Trichonephila clavipes]